MKGIDKCQEYRVDLKKFVHKIFRFFICLFRFGLNNANYFKKKKEDIFQIFLLFSSRNRKKNKDKLIYIYIKLN